MKYRMSDIRNFIEMSSCSTMSQSAKKLEMSQPALSESLKRLEADAGLILFYRSRVGITLTPAGKDFLNKSLVLMNAYEGLDFHKKSGQCFGNQSITMGCHPTVAQYSVPKALAFLKESAPDFKIDLKHDLSRNIQADVQRGNIDIGIVVNAIEVPDLIIHHLAVDTVAVWSGSKNTMDHVICNPNLFQTQSILKKWKDKPKKIISTDSLELICRLTYEQVGYGIIPERAVTTMKLNIKKMGNLPIYKDQISLVYRPEFGKTNAEKLVIESLKRSLATTGLAKNGV